MKPIIVMPMHDPSGQLFPHLEAITPQLKSIFERAFINVTAITQETQAKAIARTEADAFFQILYHPPGTTVGDEFRALYAKAAGGCRPGQILHLCFIDRVAFALQSDYRNQFIVDIEAVKQAHTPLVFQRSAAAWATHPSNYYELEQMMTRAGVLLFGKSLDFAWCYLVIKAEQLRAVLRYVSSPDLSMMAEVVLSLREQIQSKDVDWLAWEDPFIESCDPQQLKRAREQSIPENRKRLSYIIPMLQRLDAAAAE